MLLPSYLPILFELPEVVVDGPTGRINGVCEFTGGVWFAGRHLVEDVVCDSHTLVFARHHLQPCPLGQDLIQLPT